MSSALKPALPQGAGGQPPQQNSSPKGGAAGQPLGHHPSNASPAGQNAAHVPQNMAHMPQNMSIAGGMPQNMSHVGGNSAHLPGGFSLNQANKGANRSTPLSLVQEKPTGQANSSARPLSLARTPEKKESEGAQPHSNGTGDSPKAAVLNSIDAGKSPQRTPTPSESPAKPAAASAALPVPDDKPASSEPEAKVPQVADAPPAAVADAAVSREPAASAAPDTSPPPADPSAAEPSKVPETPEKSNDISESNKIDIRTPDRAEPNLDKKIEMTTESKSSDCPVPAPVSPAVGAPKDSENKVDEVKTEKDSEVKVTAGIINTENKPDEVKPDKPAAEASTPEPAAAKPATEVPVADSPAKVTPSVPSPIVPVQKKTEVRPKSTLKLATVTPTLSRKRKKEVKTPLKLVGDGVSPPKKPREKLTPSYADSLAKDDASDASGTADGRLSKRNRTKVQPYQSPTPELAILTKMSVNQSTPPPSKQNEDKLIVFYKNEFLAVRNAEGGFYVCQTMQNVYRASRKIKIRWLSQDTTADPKGEIYKPDFYDTTDMECVLTTLSLQRVGGAGLRLGAAELSRTESILGRALARDRGETPQQAEGFTEEHPDGLDLSLYKDESQLDKKAKKSPSGTPSRKRAHSKSSPASAKSQNRTDESDDDDDDDEEEEETESPKPSARKRPAPTPKRAKAKPPPKATTPAKGKTPKAKTPKQSSSSSLPPISAPTTNKAATAPAKSVASPKATKKATPSKAAKNGSSTPATPKGKVTPKTTPAKAAAAAKAAQLASTPSTSTGKATRSPRKPPSKK